MGLLLNRACASTSTTGTGTVTLGAAATPPAGEADYQSWADAGAVDGQTYSYLIQDGSDWELGYGVYTASGTTLTRNVVESTNSDAALNLSGSATVACLMHAADLAYVKIGEAVASGTPSSLTFSSIPQIFRHLEVVFNGRGSQAATNVDLLFRFNNDTGANYDREVIHAFSTGTAFSQAIGQTSGIMGSIAAASATANRSGSARAVIPNYRGTTFDKETTSHFGASLGTGTFTQGSGVYSSCWRPATPVAITRIDLLTGAGGFVNDSIACLYGLR